MTRDQTSPTFSALANSAAARLPAARPAPQERNWIRRQAVDAPTAAAALAIDAGGLDLIRELEGRAPASVALRLRTLSPREACAIGHEAARVRRANEATVVMVAA